MQLGQPTQAELREDGGTSGHLHGSEIKYWNLLQAPVDHLWNHCDYYKKLLKIYRILDCKECFTIWHAYTKELCACITWATVDDRRSFIGRNPVASDFAAGSIFDFLVSYLKGVMDAVRNANPIQRATFPHKWLSLSILDFPYTCHWRAYLQPIEETRLL